MNLIRLPFPECLSCVTYDCLSTDLLLSPPSLTNAALLSSGQTRVRLQAPAKVKKKKIPYAPPFSSFRTFGFQWTAGEDLCWCLRECMSLCLRAFSAWTAWKWGGGVLFLHWGVGLVVTGDSYGPSPVSGGAPSPPIMIEGPRRPPSAPVGRRIDPYGESTWIRWPTFIWTSSVLHNFHLF